jgi:hypothetical protein
MGDKIKFSTGTVVDADGYLHQLGTKITSSAAELNIMTGVTATADEINAAADQSGVVGTMSASTVMAATLGAYDVTTFRTGNIIKTTMYIDLTGAKTTTTDNDIIGDTGACHIGQVTTAVNGVIFAGQVSCAEVPTTGADDINLAASSVATGAYDADVTGLANAQAIMTSGGAHAIGTVKPFTVLPTADYYLYLSNGEAGTVGTFDAGILIIEMWGLAS